MCTWTSLQGGSTGVESGGWEGLACLHLPDSLLGVCSETKGREAPADRCQKQTVTCGGVEVVDAAADRPGGGHADASGDGTLVGKRYADEDSGIEVLCAKPGPGTLAADGREVPIKGAKPLPSSD